MTLRELTFDEVVKLTGDPALYHALPYLERMKAPALRVHLRYKGCASCQRAARQQAFGSVVSAFVSLTAQASEAARRDLHATVDKLLGQTAERYLVRYKDTNGADASLEF